MIIYERLERETGKEYVYRVLKNNIMSLELKPGELISESDLAKNLNVSRTPISRTPIREVLIKLKGENLIEVKPQSGTYISLIDWNLIEEAVFMRYNLEKEVLKESCENFSKETLIELEKCLFAQKLLKSNLDNLLEFHNLDNEFHRLLFEGVNKKHVWEAISNLSTHYNRMRLLAEMKLDKGFLVDQHINYLDIIKSKDKSNIERLIYEHIKSPISKWEKLIEENKDIEYYIKNKK